MNTEKTILCVWCGLRATASFHAQVDWEDLSSKWYKCEKCDGLMIIPRPPMSSINKIYSDSYQNKRLQPHPGVDNRVRYHKDYRAVVYEEYKRSLSDLGLLEQKPKSILDFGCGDGIFLEFCKKYYGEDLNVYGTDISDEMLADARRNGFNTFTVDAVLDSDMKFDLITMWDVIEHLLQPDVIMKKLSDLLLPEGRIAIQTPCFGVLGELLKEDWSHLLPVQHVSIASKKSMEFFADELGLCIDKTLSFGANAPASHVQQPYKKVFDLLVKKLDVGITQIVSLKRKNHEPL
jgi:2-polyprenyl-3-methyl-5-hydroxy-6-metoxy-1,4-benzoquinol methylase